MNPSSTLRGVRILSLALNLPGPAALMRLRSMGAQCTKLEPLPAPAQPSASGDPMGRYAPKAYQDLHHGVKVVQADLKAAAGQKKLHMLLAKTDVLITSFRPSALKKLGLDWRALHRQYPALCMVTIVGSPGAGAEIPGHDLTYLAANDLVTGLDLPATLYADMAGSLLTTEAVLQALWRRAQAGRQQGKGTCTEVALEDAAAYLALPRHWGLTAPKGSVGGAHAGYRVYACKNGRVAVAALEPHFAARLCAVAGLDAAQAMRLMHKPETIQHLQAFFAAHTRQSLDRLARTHDIPWHTLA